MRSEEIKYVHYIFYELENATALGERTRVLHRWFYITAVLYIRTKPEGHLVSYSILCPQLWPRFFHSELGNK